MHHLPIAQRNTNIVLLHYMDHTGSGPGSTLTTVTLFIFKDGSPISGAEVSLLDQTATTDNQGRVEFSDITTNTSYPVIIQDGDGSYNVTAYILSSNVEVNLTGKTAETTGRSDIPPARQEAYERASETAPWFAGVFLVLGVAMLFLFQLINKKVPKKQHFLRIALNTLVFILILIVGVFGFAYFNGTQDKLFALILPTQSTMASEEAIAPPENVTYDLEPGSITITWDAPSKQSKTPVSGYIVTWQKTDADVLGNQMITGETSARILNLESGVEYRFEIRSSAGQHNLSVSAAVPLVVTIP